MSEINSIGRVQLGMLYEEEINLIDNSKPREERNFKELYDTLDETKQLQVFVIDDVENEIQSGASTHANNANKPTFRLRVNHMKEVKNVRLSRKIINEFGFQDPHGSTSRVYDDYMVRPFTMYRNETVSKLMKKKKNQAEYDLDEQDWLYLSKRNESEKNFIKISPEVLEIMITRLEYEWDNLEKQISTIVTADDEFNNNFSLNVGMDAKYGNDDGIVAGSAEEQRCAVCNDSDCDNSNAIVFCDGCNIAVHQECYGIAFIPEGQWLCRKCMINKSRSVKCVFCPSETGAFKQLGNSMWSHVVCALWINELYFANPIYLEPIEGLEAVPRSRWKLTCYICKQKVGACIQCCNRNCFQAYHVTCAKRACLYMSLTKGFQGALVDKSSLKSYCDKHSPLGWNTDLCYDGIRKTRLYYRDLKISDERRHQIVRNRQTANRFNIFKWKTEKGSPIAPKLFSDKLFSLLINLNIEDESNLIRNMSDSSILKDLGYKPRLGKEAVWNEIRDVCNEVCRYWCLKREARNGAPLVRKNNDLMATSSIVYGGNSKDEVARKTEIGTILLKDIEKVIGLAESTMKRQEAQENIIKLELSIAEKIHYPLKVVLENLIQRLEKFDPHRLLIHNGPKSDSKPLWSIMKEKVNSYKYHSPQIFIQDITEIHRLINLHHKPTNNITKVINKIQKFVTQKADALDLIQKKIEQDDKNHAINVPFIELKGLHTSFTDADPSSLMAMEDLSEVEEMSEIDNKYLLRFLNNT